MAKIKHVGHMRSDSLRHYSVRLENLKLKNVLFAAPCVGSKGARKYTSKAEQFEMSQLMVENVSLGTFSKSKI